MPGERASDREAHIHQGHWLRIRRSCVEGGRAYPPAPDVLKARVRLATKVAEAAWTHYSTALARLSPIGVAKVRAHLPASKARIRIVPPPPM